MTIWRSEHDIYVVADQATVIWLDLTSPFGMRLPASIGRLPFQMVLLLLMQRVGRVLAVALMRIGPTSIDMIIPSLKFPWLSAGRKPSPAHDAS